MIILGIETSCDDTSCSIVEDGKTVLSNVIANQEDFHRKFNGVVPEIASRKHLELILPVIENSLNNANKSIADLNAIAVSSHPGLIGSLLVGVNTAKTLSYTLGIPLYDVNHLAAHLYTINLTHNITYPLLGLIVSGGHSLIVKALSPTDITILGSTIDDACGEAFDKVAKHYNLGFPGGPAIDKLAQKGNPNVINYPIITLDNKNNRYNFSYSGLKTAVAYQTKKLSTVSNPKIEDICASFQKAAFRPLYLKIKNAIKESGINNVGICGGVSANSYLRNIFTADKDINSYFPELKYCTDNAAMVAGLAWIKYKNNEPVLNPLSLKPSSTNLKKANLIK